MRSAYVALAAILLLNVVYQFVSAGMVVFEGEDVDTHGMGANIAHLWPLLMVIVAVIGKLGRTLIITPIVLLLLIGVQYAIAKDLGVLHPLVGLIIAFGAYHALMAARRAPDRSAGGAPAPPTPGTPTV